MFSHCQRSTRRLRSTHSCKCNSNAAAFASTHAHAKWCTPGHCARLFFGPSPLVRVPGTYTRTSPGPAAVCRSRSSELAYAIHVHVDVYCSPDSSGQSAIREETAKRSKLGGVFLFAVVRWRRGVSNSSAPSPAGTSFYPPRTARLERLRRASALRLLTARPPSRRRGRTRRRSEPRAPPQPRDGPAPRPRPGRS